MSVPRLPKLDLSGAAVGALALTVQLAYLADSAGDPTFDVPTVDAATYHQQAVQFAQGGRLFRDAFWQPPLFPLLLGCLYRFAGVSVLLAKLAQCGLATLSCVLVWWIGRRVFCRRVGVVAGAMAAAYGPFVFYGTQLLPTGLAICLDLVAVALWLKCLERPKWHMWLLFGLAVGAATITVANAFVILIVAVVGTVVLCSHDRTLAAMCPAVCVASLGTIIPIGSVAVRNYLVSGEIVPISTNGGINFFIGNNPRSDETVAIRPGERWQRLARESYLHGARTRAQQNTHFFRRGLEYAAWEPVGFLTGLGRKTLQLLNAREIPRNEDPYIHRDYSRLLALLLWRSGSFGFPLGLLAPLAAVGAVMSLSTRAAGTVRQAGRYALLAFIGAYGASVVLFFVSSRYRLPAVMVMTVFAAAGACRVWDRMRPRTDAMTGQRAFSGEAIALVVTAILVNLPLSFPTDVVNFRAELALTVGHAHAAAGRIEQAERYMREALRLDPHYADAAAKLASVLRTRGRSEEAEDLLREALTWDGQSMEARQVLAELLHKKGQTADAVALLEQGLSMDPTSPEGHAALAQVLADGGRTEEAIAHYRRAADLTEDCGPALIRLADLLVQTGAFEEAIECYREVLWRIDPDPATLNRVAWLLATCPAVELRDCRKAIEIAEHVCGMTSYANPVAMDTLAAAYAECGRLEEAVGWARQAIETASANEDMEAVNSFRPRLDAYESRLSARGGLVPSGDGRVPGGR